MTWKRLFRVDRSVGIVAILVGVLLTVLAVHLDRRMHSISPFEERAAILRHIESCGGYLSFYPSRGGNLGSKRGPAVVALVAFEADEFSIDVVPSLFKMPDLRVIIASGKTVDDNAARELAKLNQLTGLELNATGVSDAGLLKLSDLSNLERLVLAECTITDRGLEAVSKLPRLCELDVRGTRITDYGLTKIMKNCAKLRTLDVSYTNVSPSHAEMMRAARPEVEIVCKQSRQ